eukprot:SAG11_NODE_557_length_8549_cov_5.574675_1_plen_64_part_00
MPQEVGSLETIPEGALSVGRAFDIVIDDAVDAALRPLLAAVGGESMLLAAAAALPEPEPEPEA